MIFKVFGIGICITLILYLLFEGANKILDWLQEHTNVTTRNFLFWLFITLLVSTTAYLILIQEAR